VSEAKGVSRGPEGTNSEVLAEIELGLTGLGAFRVGSLLSLIPGQVKRAIADSVLHKGLGRFVVRVERIED
jgi:hypothetical protein